MIYGCSSYNTSPVAQITWQGKRGLEFFSEILEQIFMAGNYILAQLKFLSAKSYSDPNFFRPIEQNFKY